jgi:hypothetical protein
MNYARTRREGIPLRPDPDAEARRSVASLVRAAIGTGLHALDKQTTPQQYVKQNWDDHVADMVLRAAVSPASLSGNAALAHVSVSFLEALTPISAGADL